MGLGCFFLFFFSPLRLLRLWSSLFFTLIMDFTKTELDSENTDLFTLVTQSLKEFVLSPRVSGGHEQITYLFITDSFSGCDIFQCITTSYLAIFRRACWNFSLLCGKMIIFSMSGRLNCRSLSDISFFKGLKEYS